MKQKNISFNLWKAWVGLVGINFSKLDKMSLDKLCFLVKVNWLIDTEREQVELSLVEKADTDLIVLLLDKQYLCTSKARLKIISRGCSEEINKMISSAYFNEKHRNFFDNAVLDALFARGEDTEIYQYLIYTRFCQKVRDKDASLVLSRNLNNEVLALADCNISDEIISKIINRGNLDEIRKFCFRANKKVVECIFRRNKIEEMMLLVENNHLLHRVDGALERLFTSANNEVLKRYLICGGRINPSNVREVLKRFSLEELDIACKSYYKSDSFIFEFNF